MLDNLMTLAVAKAKAVGLVAGTALVTTALVGGGAVAMTVVSNEKAQEAPVAAASAIDLQAAGEGGESRSDTATANIDRKGEDRGERRDGEGQGCGEAVSAVAEAETDETSGRDHGAAVSAAARDCNGADGRGSERGSSEQARANRPAQAEDKGAQRDAAPGGERPVKPAQAERGQTESGQTESRGGRPDDAGPPAEAGSSAGKGGGRG